MTPHRSPGIGEVVHYVSHGSPVREDGTQAFTSKCRAAIVTEHGEDGVVGLMVANPTGQFFQSIANGGSPFDDWDSANAPRGALPQGGSWHWPEAV